MPGFNNDTELLTALHDKEPQALEEVFHTWYRQLCYFAEKLLEDPAAAEDIAVNCFVTLLERNPHFESLSKLRSFLFTVARNACLDVIKTEKRHTASHKELRYLASESEMDIERQLIRSEAIKILHAEIELLPPQCRRIIRLSFIEGKSVKEIAEEMQLAYQTVQNQKQRGIHLLRIAFEDKDLPATFTMLLLILKLM